MRGDLLIDIWAPGKPGALPRPITMLLIRGGDGEKNKRWFKDDEEPRLRKDIIPMIRTPEGKSKTKRDIMKVGLTAMGEAGYNGPVLGPIVVDMICVFAPNVSDPASVKAAKARGGVPMVSKPDLDNIAKGVLDGLNGVAYHDDNQVVAITVHKIYGPQSGLRARVYRADIASLSTAASDLFPDGICPSVEAGPLFAKV